MDELEQYPPFLDLSMLTERTFVPGEQACNATKELPETEGIFGGQSSGAIVYQAKKVVEQMDSDNIVMILADGGVGNT